MAELSARMPAARTTEDATVLSGSLRAFSLVDVLELLCRSSERVQLSVTAGGEHMDLCIDRGDLLDPTGDGPRRADLLWAAAAGEGTFAALAPGLLPEHAERLALGPLLAELAPMVDEFVDLCALLPLGALVRMSPSTDAEEIRIRADQWEVLCAVGTSGTSVRAALAATDQHPLAALRTMWQMVEVGLVGRTLAPLPSLAPPPVASLPAGGPAPMPGVPAGPPAPSPRPPRPARTPARRPSAGTELPHHGSLMPPPVAGDPWAGALAGPT